MDALSTEASTLDGSTTKAKSRKQKVTGYLASRKAALMTKLLSRHKRLEGDAKQGSVSDECESGKEHTRATQPKQAQPNPRKDEPKNRFKRFATKGLRRANKKPVVAAAHDNEHHLRPMLIRPPPPSKSPISFRPLQVNVSVASPISPLTPPSSLEESVARRTYTPIDPRSRDYQHGVIESAISRNLMNDFDAEDSVVSETMNAKRRLHVMVRAVGVVGVCLCSIVLLGFSWIPTISCLVTIVLCFHMVEQVAVLESRECTRNDNQCLMAEKESWQMANSHLRSRIMAAKAYLLRAPKTHESLDKVLTKSNWNMCDTQRIATMSQRLTVNRKEMERRLRSEVLLVVSRAIVLSNKKSKPTVLNSLGVDIITRRLSKMKGVQFNPDDFQHHLDHYGQSREACIALFKLILYDGSALIKYEPSELRS